MTKEPALLPTLLSTLVLTLAFPLPALASERQIMMPRVPADQLEAARALASPLADSPESIEKGKALYKGKGTCVNCHGESGRGDGVAAVGLDPSPRNFHQHGFWRHRTEGELFWVIKHGVSGTGMVPFGNVLSDEEIWAVIQYERTFAGGHGPREGMGPRGGMGGMGRHGPRGSAESPGEMEPRDGPCCTGPDSSR